MVASILSSATFHPFPRLPPELRQQVWYQALLDHEIAPALFFFREHCWYESGSSPVDPVYGGNVPCYNRTHMAFDIENLDDISLQVPLACVSREARAIAVKWARACGFGICQLYYEIEGPIFIRSMNPSHDALFIYDDEALSAFMYEPDEMVAEPDNWGKELLFRSHLFTHLALTLAMFHKHFPEVLEFLLQDLTRHPNLNTLCIIVNAEPTLEYDDNVAVTQCCWEFTKMTYAFIWNEDRKDFEMRTGGFVGDDALYRSIKNTCSELSDFCSYGRSPQSLSGFNIQPVLAERKPQGCLDDA